LMKKFVFSIFFLFLCAALWGQVTYTWDDGVSGDWDDETNWFNETSLTFGDGYPGIDDTANINDGIINLTSDIEIDELQITGNASLVTSGLNRIEITGTITVNGTLTAGVDVYSNNIIIDGTLILNSGSNDISNLTINISGTFILGSNSGNIGALNSAGTLDLNTHTLNVTGVFNQTTGGVVQTISGIINAGSFHQAGGSITGNSLIIESGNEIYLGTVNISGALNLKSINDIEINGTVNSNSITLESLTGNVIINDNVNVLYFHVIERHIVYSPADTGSSVTAQAYVFIDSTEYQNTTFFAGIDRNIYIVDAVNVFSNTFNCTDASSIPGSGAGFIEIHNNYHAASAILNAGSGGIRLSDADIIMSSGNFNTNSKTLSLINNVNNESKIKTNTQIVISNGISGGGNSIILESPSITITGSVSGVNHITVESGDILFHNSINANSYTQQNGTARFEAAQNYTGAFSFSGSHLVITNNANLSAGTFTQTVASGSSEISSDISTNGIISFAGTAAVNANIILDSSAGNGNIIFSNNSVTPAVSGAGALELKAGTGNISFSGQIGVSSTHVSDITVVSANNVTFSSSVFSGDIDINSTNIEFNGSSITATGNQTYNAAVTLGNNLNLIKSGAGNSLITFQKTVTGGTHSLTISNANVQFDEVVNLRDLTISGGNTTIYKDITTGGIQSYGGNVTIAGASPRTLSSGVSGVAGNQTFSGNVTLNTDLILKRGSGTDNKIVRFAGTVNGSHQLTITDADVQFENNAGTASNRLSGLTVNANFYSVAGNSTIHNNIYTIGNLDIDGNIILNGTYPQTLSSSGGSISINGNVSGTGIIAEALGDIEMNSDNPTFNLSVASAAGDIIINHTGNLSIIKLETINTKNIDLNVTGTINQTGIIETGSLKMASGGQIILEGNNEAGMLEITGTGGLVRFYNNIDLTIASISRTGGAVNISTGANINVNGAINCFSLALTANNGKVSINSTINTASANPEGTNASVYISADILEGTGSITLGSSGEVCANVSNTSTYTGNVSNGHIHYHAIGNRHIVYSPNNTGHGLTAGTYIFINSNNIRGRTFNAGINSNIYIINAGNLGANINIFNCMDSSAVPGSGSGFIEIHQNYISDSIVLNHGSGGIKFLDADIRIDTAFDTKDKKLTLLNGTLNLNNVLALSIDVSDIFADNAGDLTLEASGTIAIKGDVGTSAALLGDITIKKGDTVFSINSPVFANSYTQIEGTAVIGASQKYTNNFNFTGTDLVISSGAELSAVNITAQITTAGSIQLNGNVKFTALNNIVFDGLAELDDNVILTASNDINFNEFAELGDDVILTASNNIIFNESIKLGDNVLIKADKQITIDGELEAEKVTIENGDEYTQNGNITISGSFIQQGNGDVVLKGNIVNDNQNKNTSVISFTGEVSIFNNSLKILIHRNGGKVELKKGVSVVSGDSLLTLEGGSSENAALEFSSGGVLDNVTIAANSYVKVNTTIEQKSGKILILEAETSQNAGNASILDVSAGTWNMGGTGALNQFAGINGTLNLFSGSKLIAHNVNLAGSSFIVNNNSWATISAKGNVIIEDTITGIHPQLIIEMAGNTQELTAHQKIGSLHVKSSSQTTLKNDLEISGEVQIEYLNPNGILHADDFNITLFAELNENGKKVSRWKIINAPETISGNPVSSYNMNAFTQNTDRFVELKKESFADDNVFFEIIGNTVWQTFKYEELGDIGAVIQFSLHPDQHIFLHSFDVNGKSNLPNKNGYVTLTRYTGTLGWTSVYPSTVPPNVPPGAESGIEDDSLPRINPIPRNLKTDNQENIKFWNFNLVSHGGHSSHRTMNISYVKILFSHAWNQRIPIAVDTMHLDAIPYFAEREGNIIGFFNYDWVEVRKIIYSFIEDSNGNGRADRIRVQTNVALNGDFSKFTVEVEGYKVDLSRPTINPTPGFDIVNALTMDASDGLSFYIYIEEKTEHYGGEPVKWWVTRNESLKDMVTQTLLVGDPITGDVDKDEFFTTTNTIPPRVSYVITLPGHPQTFIKMSQPVAAYTDTLIIDGKNFKSYSEIDKNNSYLFALEYYPFDQEAEQYFIKIPEGTLSYLLELDSSPNAADLAKLPAIGINTPPDEYFTLEGLSDLGVRALDWFDEKIDSEMFMYYPSPRYPVNWNYTQYKTYTGNSHVTGYDVTEDDDVNNPTDVFLPPNKLLTPEMVNRLNNGGIVLVDCFDGSCSHALCANADNKKRRSTDVLVSLPPASSSSSDYFVWPVWARHKKSDNISINNNFWQKDDTDTDLIWEFDGTKYLEANQPLVGTRGQIELQVNSGIAGNSNLEISWSVNVPETLRYPKEMPVRGRSQGGLWLPGNNLLYNFTPVYNENNINRIITNSLNFPLYNFILEDPINSGNKVEFIFRFINSDMFIARLDIPLGGEVPHNWYTLIRPFSFDVQDIRLQRGGVTILNNVINSNNRETTYIRYNLVRPGRVTIQVYTLDGTLVKSIRRNEYRAAGEYTDAWDGTNNGGRSVARGMYFVRVVAPDIDEIRKVMVVK